MRKQLINMSLSRLFLTATLFIGLLVGPTSGQVRAQSIDSLDRLFTIKAIKVDETARRASEARSAALANAERQAYDKLLLKITQPEGRALLPELSDQQKQALVSGIEVVEEQSSSRRYIATLNVRFEPGNVSQFLAQYGVPHVLSTGKGILVLHAHSEGVEEHLWVPSGAMEAARDTVDWLNRIRQYEFPAGTMAERFAVSFREVAAFETSGTRNLAALHQVQSILMISSSWEMTLQGHRLMYRFLSTDNGQVKAGMIAAPGSQSETLVQMYREILENIDTEWRDQLLVDTGTGGTMVAKVPSISLDVLTNVENRLAEVTLAQGFRIHSVGLPFSEVSFNYTGREEQLVMALRFAGLTLDTYGDDKILKLREEQ